VAGSKERRRFSLEEKILLGGEKKSLTLCGFFGKDDCAKRGGG